MTEITVGKSYFHVKTDDEFVSGSRRIYKCRIALSEDWQGLDVALHFVNGSDQVAVIPEGGECEIPWEVIAHPGVLLVGAVGTAEDGTVRVSIQQPIGLVKTGVAAEQSEETAEPTPGMIAQLHALARQAADRAAEIQRLIDAGELGGGSAGQGKDGITPHIGENGNWFIGEDDTGVKAQGEDGNDGKTPRIGSNGHWFVGDDDTGIKAQGDAGNNGLSPHIGVNGHWYVGENDTGVKARGEDGSRGASGLVPKVIAPYAPAVEVAANTMTEIGTLAGAITVTLGAPEEGFDNEWDFVIQQGATAQTVTLPTVVWGMGMAPTFAAGSVTVVRLYYIGATLRGEWTI